MKNAVDVSRFEAGKHALSPGRNPRVAGLMAGALLLCSLAAAPVAAEPAKKHEPRHRSLQGPAAEYQPDYQPRYQPPHQPTHQPTHQPRFEPRFEPRHQAHQRAQPQPSPRVLHGPRVQHGPRFLPPAPVLYQSPAERARPHAYRFRTGDRAHLRAHYHDSLRSVRAHRRPHLVPGRVIPIAYRRHISRLPQHLGHRLPPPPRGYHVGYYQGYSVVYDPLTFTIVGLLDLLSP